MAHHMFGEGKFRLKFSKPLKFAFRLLHSILADVFDARLNRFGYQLRRVSLTDRDHFNLGCAFIKLSGGLVYSIKKPEYIVLNGYFKSPN